MTKIGIFINPDEEAVWEADEEASQRQRDEDIKKNLFFSNKRVSKFASLLLANPLTIKELIKHGYSKNTIEKYRTSPLISNMIKKSTRIKAHPSITYYIMLDSLIERFSKFVVLNQSEKEILRELLSLPDVKNIVVKHNNNINLAIYKIFLTIDELWIARIIYAWKEDKKRGFTRRIPMPLRMRSGKYRQKDLIRYLITYKDSLQPPLVEGFNFEEIMRWRLGIHFDFFVKRYLTAPYRSKLEVLALENLLEKTKEKEDDVLYNLKKFL